EEGSQADKKNVRVFLTGSPKKLVKKYIDIFKKAKLELASIETETFSIVRSLLGSDKTPVMIVEIGANSTDLSIVRESIPVLNRSLEISGNTITELLSQNLGLSIPQAEQFKFDLSISLSEDNREELPQLILQALQPIINEMEYMLDFFQSQNTGRVEKIILSGGGSLLLNLAEFLAKKLNIQVIIGDPWNRVSYPTELRPVVLEVGPKLAVAIGLALREIE
ncbi:MAG: pilus assembly protein PilM, partial [Candidatus Falkowbacteria bacterium]|nr:pilus assembly protein PilM [Candidatus Falkowbacteria bacterium]